MLRIIIAVIYLAFFFLISIPMFLVEWIIGKFNKRAMDISSLYFVRWGFRCVLWISGAKVTVIGEENIPDEPVLYVGNHRSFFDIVLIYSRCKRPTGFVAKDSTKKVPFLRVWMRYLHCLFLDRDNLKEGLKTILQAIEYVKQGIDICIFPEGTRNKGEELSMLPFRDGAFKIATKTGCPIIPVSMNNMADIFENHFPRLKNVNVVIEYGKPIYPKELDKETLKHIGPYCHTIIQETLQKNASLI